MMKKSSNMASANIPSPLNSIRIEHISKSYDHELVLNDVSLTLTKGRIYCLMAPSGTGKTTLFRILLGLEHADSGQIDGLNAMQLSAVFQEDRLLEGYTALENLRFATGRHYTNEELTTALLRLLPADALAKPVHEFSGGMKRRTAILRAILAASDFIIMDEPFTGLDAETKLQTIDLIREYCDGKLVLISTHNPEDAGLLGAEIITLSNSRAYEPATSTAMPH